jgi:hypothetical protein
MSDQHTTVQYQLRLSEELRDSIKRSAKSHNRSMNADIVARLEDSLSDAGGEVAADEGLQNMAEELVALSTENRELRRLYIEAINSNFENIPNGLKSKYGRLLNELEGDD